MPPRKLPALARGLFIHGVGRAVQALCLVAGTWMTHRLLVAMPGADDSFGLVVLYGDRMTIVRTAQVAAIVATLVGLALASHAMTPDAGRWSRHYMVGVGAGRVLLAEWLAVGLRGVALLLVGLLSLVAARTASRSLVLR